MNRDLNVPESKETLPGESTLWQSRSIRESQSYNHHGYLWNEGNNWFVTNV